MRLLVLALLSFFTSKAFSVDLQNFYFSDSYKYSVIDDSFILKHPGGWVITSSLAFVNDPLVIADSESLVNEGVVVDDHKVLNLGFSYNFRRWLSFGVDTSYVVSALSDEEGPLNAANTAALAQGYQIDDGGNLGDITLRAKWRVFRHTPSKFAIALIPRITIPVGKKETFTSSESLRWGLLAVAEKLWSRWAVQGALGYSQSKDAEYGIIDYDKIINLQFGLSYRVSRDWTTNFELVRNVSVGELENADQDSGDYYLTAKYRANQNVDVYGGAGIAGFNDIDEENYTVFAGLKIHPGKKERPREKTNLELENIDDQKVQNNQAMEPVDANLAVNGLDVDTKGNRLNYACSFDKVVDDSVVSGTDCGILPGFEFDSQSGYATWSPNEEAIGPHEFKIDAFLNGELLDDEIFVITVKRPEVASRDEEKTLGTLFKADRVYFDNSSTTIKRTEINKLDEVADYLIKNATKVNKVIVEGYASKVGPSAFNQELSANRADKVMKYLVSRGVSAELLQAVAYGDNYLNEEPEHWQNRRVEFRIYNRE